MRAARAERGQVTLLALGLLLVCIAVSGFAIDATRALLLRQSLQHAADAATLAGAGELDLDAYYATGGRRVALDTAAARATALAYLVRRGLPVEADVRAGPSAITVALGAHLRTTFLRIVGIDRVAVSAAARAAPRPGRP